MTQETKFDVDKIQHKNQGKLLRRSMAW